MKRLTERQEVAEALNFGKYPVLEIDLSKCDEYGLVGSIARIDMGEFRDGSKWYERAELRVYGDERKIVFASFGCALTDKLSYMDFSENVQTAMAPIIKADSEFAVVIHDSVKREAYAVYVLSTGHVSRHCTQPIMVETVDMTGYVVTAGARYGKDYGRKGA